MNHSHDSFSEPDDEPMLKEMLSHLRSLEPPLETRIANRMAIAAELSASCSDAKPRLPWWRRSISIPTPVAASLLVLMGIALASSVRGRIGPSSIQVAAPAQFVKSSGDVRDKKAEVTATHTPHPTVASNYYVAETYLCGIGRVSSESYYFIKEQNP